METLLQWCESCSEDMHEVGGTVCEQCGVELCWDCYEEHNCESDWRIDR